MRLCSAENLKPGDVIGKSIFFSNNRLLLGAGYRVTSSIKKKLIEKGYSHVYILEEGTEDVIPEDVISEEVRLQAKIELEDKVRKIQKSAQFQEMSYTKVVETLEKGNLKDVELSYEMRKIVKEIILEITSADIKFMNTLMLKSSDTFFFDHAINTTVLTILIGKKYRFEKSELINLGLGAFLHDIGKVIIEQLGKDEEKKEIIDYYREHPTFGYLLLSNDNNISPQVLQTVNQHHEQQDGKGFPLGLKGNNLPPVKTKKREKGYIYRFAEICCIADAYDRLLLSPLNGNKLMPSDVIKELLKSAGTIYNKSIIETLIQIIPIYPVGSYIKVANVVDPSLIGCYGVVAKINEKDLKNPTIIITANKYGKKIKPIIIDTSKLTLIELKIII